MASIMRLRPHHKQYHIVLNPLVANAEVLTVDQIELKVKQFLDNSTAETRDAAIMAFSSIIRHLVGRYIGAFRSIRRLEDDLVTTAFLTVITSIDNRVASEDVCRVVSNRIVRDITAFINKFRSVVSPCIKTQQRRAKDGRGVLYSVDLTDDHDNPTKDCYLMELEFMSSLFELPLTDIERKVIHPDNWGLSTAELAEKLDIPRRTMADVVAGLMTKAKEVLYAD